jgi:hypothetical protein
LLFYRDGLIAHINRDAPQCLHRVSPAHLLETANKVRERERETKREGEKDKERAKERDKERERERERERESERECVCERE